MFRLHEQRKRATTRRGLQNNPHKIKIKLFVALAKSMYIWSRLSIQQSNLLLAICLLIKKKHKFLYRITVQNLKDY